MKGFFQKRNVVVPLKERRDVRPVDQPPLAAQIAENRLLCEKLLERVQRLERREKTMKKLIQWFRFEVSRLRKELVSANVQPLSSDDSDEAVASLLPTREELLHPTTSSLSPREIRPLSEPDFSSSPADLHNDRH